MPTLMYCPPTGTAHPSIVSMIWITDTPNWTPRKAVISKLYTPVATFGVANAYPALRPLLAASSRDTTVPLSVVSDVASPLSPVKRNTISVLAERAGSLAYVPSEELCSTETDKCMVHSAAIASCGGCTKRSPPNKMYSMVDVSRVSVRLFASASMASVDTSLASTNAALATGSSFTSVYCAVSNASTPEN